MFIVFRDILINPVDVSWARTRDWHSYVDDDDSKPWIVIVHFRGVSEFLTFDYETEEKAKEGLWDFENLIRLAREHDEGVRK